MFGILAQDLEAYGTSWLTQTDSSIIHPLALVIFLVAAFWLFYGPRGKIIWSVLLIACFISVAQRFALVTMDFSFIRTIGTLGLIRILTYGELRTIKPNVTDKLMLAFVVLLVGMTGIREGPNGAVSKAGFSLDLFSMYWVGRVSLKTTKDVRMMMAALGLMAIPLSMFFIIEKTTGRNYFSMFGGVAPFTLERDGKLRAQGSFCHPIIAGVFFACFLPLAIGVIRSRVRGLASLLGGWVAVVFSVLIILMSNSSTPVAGVLIGLMAWATFRFRRSLKTWMCVAVFLMVIGHFGSSNGIHHILFTRVDFTGSSTGYHRYLLVDGLIDNVTSWAFIGDSTPGYNRSFRDITNMYVVSALAGGAITLGLLLSLVYQAFKAATQGVRNAVTREELMMMYGMGCAFTTICISFMAVACYGEGVVPWYVLLGGGVSVSQTLLVQKRVHMKKSAQGRNPQRADQARATQA